MNTTRIGLFGGTFDPPHIGHLLMASEARHQLGLSEVHLMVANIPWQKADREVTAANVRVEMCRAAVRNHEGFVVGTQEIQRGGATYTAETLRELHAKTANLEVVLIMGSDTANGLDTWAEPDVVAELATVGVVERPGSEPTQLSDRWDLMSIDAPHIEISSSDIRDRVATGRPIDFMVPDAVCTLIGERHLYGETR